MPATTKQRKKPPTTATAKQARLVEEYLVDLNISAAAIRAGYSAKSANDIGREILAMPHIAELVAQRMRERADRTKVEQDRVLQEIAGMSFTRVNMFVVDPKSGDVALADGVPEDAWAAVEAIRRKYRKDKDGLETYDVEIKLVDKVGSVRMAGQHLGMFEERFRNMGGQQGETGVAQMPSPVTAEEWLKAAAQHQKQLPGK